jgi:hypothetical protein
MEIFANYLSNKTEYIFCSAIISTIGHPILNMAMESVLNQATINGLNFEVLVVNDLCNELPKTDLQRSK